MVSLLYTQIWITYIGPLFKCLICLLRSSGLYYSPKEQVLNCQFLRNRATKMSHFYQIGLFQLAKTKCKFSFIFSTKNFFILRNKIMYSSVKWRICRPSIVSSSVLRSPSRNFLSLLDSNWSVTYNFHSCVQIRSISLNLFSCPLLSA